MNSNLVVRILTLCAAVCIVNTAYSEEFVNSPECQQQLSLEAFRTLALKNSPLIAEVDRGYAEALAEAFETETLPNPEFQLEQTATSMTLGGDNDPQSQVTIGQALRLSNFGSRSEVAKLMRKSGELDKRVALMEFFQKVSLQYETLAVYQQIETVLQAARDRAAKKVAVVKEGVVKGLLTEGDHYLFEGEKYRLQAEGLGVATIMSNLRHEISKSVASPCLISVTFDKTVENIPSEAILIKQAKESQLSESSRVDLLLKLTSEQVRLAALDSYPQVTPRLVYQHTNDGGDFFGAGIAISLPFWNRNEAAQYKANADRKVAVARSAFIRDGGLDNQVRTLRQAVVSAGEQVAVYRGKVVPSFERALRAQEQLYVQGQGDILPVWQTLTTLNEVQTKELEYLLQAKILRIQLSTLVGEEL